MDDLEYLEVRINNKIYKIIAVGENDKGNAVLILSDYTKVNLNIPKWKLAEQFYKANIENLKNTEGIEVTEYTFVAKKQESE